MRDLPEPTLPLSAFDLPRGRLHRPDQPLAAFARGEIEVVWARHLDEVRAAQRLRYLVFAGEMGARLASGVPGYDADLFDPHCEHLLLRDRQTREVIATCRVLTPENAKRIGTTGSDLQFDLTRLRGLRERMVELGRSCVHPAHRHGGVILALWAALTEFMVRNRFDTLITCARMPMLRNGVFSGDLPASVWRQLRESHMAPIEQQVWPRLALPVSEFDGGLDVTPPALVRGYLRLGAKVLGAPAWDPDFNTADLPLLMRMADMPVRYRRRFAGDQAGLRA